MIATSNPIAGLPKYRQIAHVLRERILAGMYQPGGLFPSEPDIAEEFNAHRGTVRAAITLLRGEGLLDVVHGKGTYVRKRERMIYMPQRESSPHPVTAEMDRFMKQITDEQRTPGQTIRVQIVVPAQPIAERLKLGPADTAVARLREQTINGDLVKTNDSYFPLDVVQGSEIMNPADIPRGTNQVLEDLGYAQVRAVDEFYARMPTPDEKFRLNLGPGAPVIVHLVTGYTADGRPVRCTENILSDRNVIVYEREWK